MTLTLAHYDITTGRRTTVTTITTTDAHALDLRVASLNRATSDDTVYYATMKES